MTEHELQTEILKKYGALPWLRIWRQNTGVAVGMSIIAQARKAGFLPDHLPMTRYGQPGQPDILGLIGPNGKFLGIECKSEKGKQTPEQKTWQTMIESLGGIYILARSLDDVSSILMVEKNKFDNAQK